MKWASYFKISNEMLKDQRAMTLVIQNDFLRNKKKLYHRSLKAVGNITITMNLDGDDFARELTMVVTRYTVYKMPRIVKNLMKRRYA